MHMTIYQLREIHVKQPVFMDEFQQLFKRCDPFRIFPCLTHPGPGFPGLAFMVLFKLNPVLFPCFQLLLLPFPVYFFLPYSRFGKAGYEGRRCNARKAEKQYQDWSFHKPDSYGTQLITGVSVI